MNMQLSDIEHRKRALNPLQSFIIHAGAGSGKTKELIDSILSKLAIVRKPEHVVALTYTNKAAAEMVERLIESLVAAKTRDCPKEEHLKTTWLLARSVLDRDEELGWNVIMNPHRLQIMTIDSLCASIVKQLPVTSGIGGSANITDDAEKIYRAAVLELLSLVDSDNEWSDAVGKVLRHLNNDTDRFVEMFSSLLAKRDQWEPIVFTNTGHNKLKSILANTLIRNIDRLVSSAPENFVMNLPSIDSLLRYSMNNLGLNYSALDDHQRYSGYAKLLSTSSGTIRKSVTKTQGFPAPSSLSLPDEKNEAKQLKELFKDVSDSLSGDADSLTFINTLNTIPTEIYSDKEWTILDAMFEVLPVLSGLLKMKFQQAGVCDFIAVTQCASASFHDDVADVALLLDNQISHLLVDEFQDTNLSHFRLLESLMASWVPGDGRTVYLTGDLKQAIYGFREGDVSLFMQVMKFGIGPIKPIPLQFSTNFRSETAIVDWVNQTFASAFPSKDSLFDGAVSYCNSHAFNPTTVTGNSVSLTGVIGGGVRGEIDHLASTISVDRTTYLNDSFAILVRTRSLIPIVVDSLKEHGLSVNAPEVGAAVDRSYVRDLIALTISLVSPSNSEMFAVLLTSAFVGLSLQDLANLYEFHGVDVSNRKILCHPENKNNLSFEGTLRLNRLNRVIEVFDANRFRKSESSLVEGVWLELGGFGCYKGEQELEKNTREFFTILTQIEKDNSEISKDTLERRCAFLTESIVDNDSNAIEVMTIHKSKGLEFDHVYMPCLHKKPRPMDKPLIVWRKYVDDEGLDQTMIAPVEPNPDEPCQIYAYLQSQAKARLKYEECRLLYVGCTRAIKRLVMSASIQEKEDKLVRPDERSLLNHIWDDFIDTCEFVRSQSVITHSTTPFERQVVSYEYVNNWLAESDYACDPLSVDMNYPDVSLESNDLRILGLVMHKILELFFSSFENETIKTFDRFEPAVEAILKENGCYGESYQHLIARARDTTEILLGSPFVRQLRSKQDASFFPELRILTCRLGRVEKGIIDLLVVTPSRVYIVDWKFVNQNSNESVQDYTARLIDDYSDQIVKYKSSIEDSYEQPISCVLCNPLLNIVVEMDEQDWHLKQVA